MSKKEEYDKLDDISHILHRSDTYVGSIAPEDTELYVYDKEVDRIVKKKVKTSEGFIRIFVEPMSNAVDNLARSIENDIRMTTIKVDINKETGETSFWNDGKAITIKKHETHKVYYHTMIFGQLKSSSNYDDEKERLDISGKNGLGIKLTNVFSKKFSVEGVDPTTNQKLEQEWTNNMRETDGPTITSCKLKKGYTKVTYIPDFEKFGMKGYTDNIINLFFRYLIEISMLTKLKVIFNDEVINVKSLADYSQLYKKIDNEEVEEEEETKTTSKKALRELLNIKLEKHELVVVPSDGEFEHFCFSNRIYNPKGGVHLDFWVETILRPLLEKVNTGKKSQLSFAELKNFFKFFVVASVVRPKYESQQKLELKNPKIKEKLDEKQEKTIFRIARWNSFKSRLEELRSGKDMKVLKKMERKKRGYVHVAGLEKANNEGGKKGKDCTLILVEGKSAATYAVLGISKGAFGKKGKDWFGVYALRGKVLNCRNAKPEQIGKNPTIQDIINALNLQYGVDYTLDENFNKLRYGRVLIITDADTDGIHISGLIQNMFHALYPTLLERDPPFLTSMQTPIVKIFKPEKIFYDEQEYKEFLSKLGRKLREDEYKYYKGLGSSNAKDVKRDFGKKTIQFIKDDDTDKAMNAVFSNKKINGVNYTDIRKEWIKNFDPNRRVLKWDGEKEEKLKIKYSDFLDGEVIKFSIADCKRSLPCIVDGLKESYRKILYSCFLKKLYHTKKPLKVRQLAAFCAEKTQYKHGEGNIEITIGSLVNRFVGSNNIPLLAREGMFGTRREGGEDMADGRYTSTKLEKLTRLIFREEDDPILTYIDEDGDSVEPEFYVPILPMILVNGSKGIGTGWSSNIPCYNPVDLMGCIKIWLENREDHKYPELVPWYRRYTGEIVQDEDKKSRFISKGIFERVDDSSVQVTELPIGFWIVPFKNYLEKLQEAGDILSYRDNCVDDSSKGDDGNFKINFTIEESDDFEGTEESLKLTEVINTTNMVMYDEKGTLKRYVTVDEIIDNFCDVRYKYYEKRKKYQLDRLNHEIKFLGNKKRFLEEIRDGTFVLFIKKDGKNESRKTDDIIKNLEKSGYDKDNDEKEEKEDEEDEEKKEVKKKGTGYEYLLRLQINNITAEKINKLRSDIDSKIQIRDKLASTSEKDIWLEELKEFEKEYVKF